MTARRTAVRGPARALDAACASQPLLALQKSTLRRVGDEGGSDVGRNDMLSDRRTAAAVSSPARARPLRGFRGLDDARAVARLVAVAEIAPSDDERRALREQGLRAGGGARARPRSTSARPRRATPGIRGTRSPGPSCWQRSATAASRARGRSSSSARPRCDGSRSRRPDGLARRAPSSSAAAHPLLVRRRLALSVGWEPQEPRPR